MHTAFAKSAHTTFAESSHSPVQRVRETPQAVVVQPKYCQLLQILDGSGQEGDEVVAEVEVSKPCPSTQGLRQHDQVVLGQVQEAKVVQVSYCLWACKRGGVV